MNPALHQLRLAVAERNVAAGVRRIRRQRQVIADLKRDGHDTKSARDLLAKLLKTQAGYEGDCDRLRAELAK